MKVGFYQFAPLFGEMDKNVQNLVQAIESFQGDLLVFPELALSGYQFLSQDEVFELSEEIPDGRTFRLLEEAVRDHSLTVVVGLAERDQGNLYNSAALVGPQGFMGIYRKTHLFYEETLWFSPGNTGFPVWDIGKAKVGLLVCFDWYYPESARSLVLSGAEILCHPSNLVLPYCPNAMVTRCLENRVFAITANRVGTEQRGGKDPLTFIGQSEIVAPNGDILHRASETDSALFMGEIDVEQARRKQINPYNDVLADRRPHWYVSGNLNSEGGTQVSSKENPCLG